MAQAKTITVGMAMKTTFYSPTAEKMTMVETTDQVAHTSTVMTTASPTTITAVLHTTMDTLQNTTTMTTTTTHTAMVAFLHTMVTKITPTHL